MSTTQLTMFDNSQLPAHLVDLNAEGNIVGRSTINQLSFRGKVWRVVLDGGEEVVKNAEGDPVQSVPVVILDYTKARSRSYFAGGFEEGKGKPPTCWSDDSVTPAESVKEKQHATCAGCPQSVKGSKITDAGKAIVACSSFKVAVVVPSVDTGFAPLRLKIPQTSMWDGDNKENENKGFYAFDQYMDFLKRKGVAHTAAVVTKIKFDARTAYPKLLFGAHGWTPETDTAAIKKQLAAREALQGLMHGLDASAPPVAAPVAFEAPSVAVAAPSPAKPVAATKPRPTPAAPVPEVDPDDTPASFGKGSTTPVTPPVAAKAPATSEVPAAAGAGLTALLAAWDD